MANSAINISANAQEVINLRKRIDELKASLSSMRRSTDPQAYDKLNRELQTSSIRYNRLVGDIQRYVVAQQQAERATSKSSDSLTDLLKKGAALAGITFGAEKIRELGMEIVRVHGEMQQLNIAFSTMLKSQEKADTLMSGLKTFATDTPFGLMDSAKGAKQLLAYGTTAENIIGDLKMLGNVASGVSAPLGDIVYLYGTLRSQGRAYAVDIRQFAGRGIPIYAELAKVLKVNVDQVNELVSAGKVGFPEVEQAFKNMTSGGGMFEGLMEKQTASVTGQIEKLKDNIQFMFDAIGTSSEGAIYGAIDGASTLVENYETVGKVLLGLIATYGTYRTAVMLTTTVETARISIIDKLLTAQSMENISKLNLTKGTAAYTAAVQAELAAQQKKELAVLKEIGFEARRNYVKEQGLLLSAQQAIIDAKATGASAAKITALQAEASARGKSLVTARAEMIAAAQNIATKQADIVATTTSTASTNLLTIAKTRLTAATTRLNAVLSANAYAILGAAAVALAYGIYQVATYSSDAEKAQNRFRDAVLESEKASLSETRELSKLKGELSEAKKGTDEYNSIKEKIVKGYGKYYDGLEKEIDKVGLLDNTYKKLTESIQKSFAARQYTKFIQQESDNLDNVMSENLGKIQDKLIEKLGDEAGTKYYTRIRQALVSGSLKANNAYDITGLDKETQGALDKIAGKGDFIQNRAIEGYIKEIIRANELTDELDKKAKIKFGIDDSKPKTGDESTPTIISTYNDQLKSAQDNVSKLEKDLANLRKGIRPVDIKADVQFDFSKNIEEKAKELKDAQDKLSYLTTGQSYSASNKANNAAETAAEKARKTAQKALDDQLKLDNDKAKASLDARNQELENQQALLNLQEDGFKKEQKQAEINHQKELLSIDKRAQELIEAKQKAERDAWDIKNPNPKTTYVNKTVSSSDLLLGQQSELNNSRDIANRAQIKANADLLKNLLEKYQDFNAKKVAIDKQYNKDLQALESQRTNDNSESINRSISQLKKQYEESISAINIDELRESIDWQTVFGDIDRVSSQSIENLRSKLKEYASEAGKNLAPTDMKTLTDAIDQLDKKYAELKPNKAFTDSFNDYKAATDNVKRLRQELEVIKSGGNITIGAEYDKESGKMTTVVKTQTQAEKDLTDAQNKRRQSLISLGTALQGYVSKSQQYLDLANETVSTLESFGVKVPEGVSKTLEGLGQISSGMDDVSKGLTSMNPVLIAQGGIKALGGLANAVQGIFGKRNKAADDTKQLQDITSKIEVTNKSINSLIEKRIDLINDATAAEAGYLNTLTQGQIKTQQEYVQGMLDRLSGNEIFGKKGKNNNLTLTALMDREGLTSMDDFVKWWNEEGGVAKLTAEGYDLKNEDQWQSIIDAWSSLKDAAEDAETAMKEAATGISFDSLKDSLDDLVQDVNTTFSDISDSFEDHMRNAVMNFVKSSYLTKALQDWYDKFAEAYSDDVLTSDEVDALQNMYNEAYNKAQDMYDSALKAAGVSKGSTSQSSSYGTSTSMDQETGGAILGRLTGVHEELIGIGQNVGYIAQWNQPMDEKFNVDVLRAPIDSLNESCQRIELMIEENRNITLQTLYVVKDIKVDTSNLSEINDKLGRIENNTKAFKGK